MHLSGKVATSIVGLIALVSAGAAEAQSPPIWNGAYLGASLGGGFGKSRQSNNTGLVSGDYNISGVAGGITGGYNFQSSQLVFGLETDLNAANIKGSILNNICGTSTGCSSTVKGFHTARARVGFAAGSFLPYATAGVAVGNLNAAVEGASSTASATRTGFVYGLGAEMSLNRNWSIKAEYLRTSFGQMDVATNGTTLVKGDFNGLNIIRAGVNYKF